MAAKTAMKEPKRSSALVRRETFASYCFLLPSLIFFLGFVIYPMILCVVTSFFDSTMNRADIFVGMANYKTLFADPIFLGALKNTFVIVIVSVPITCIFSLWVASAIVNMPPWATSPRVSPMSCAIRSAPSRGMRRISAGGSLKAARIGRRRKSWSKRWSVSIGPSAI